jgi:hypothetical protein
MVAGSQVAHALAYRIVYPDAQVRWQVLLSTGHDYLSYWPLLFGVVGGVLLVGFAATLVAAVRRHEPRPVPAWAFALLPLLGFTVQEFAERWLIGGGFPWWAVLQPTFRIGLLLQLPFALIAFLLARFLLRSAEGVVRVLRPGARIPQPLGVGHSWFVCVSWPLRSAVLADGHAGRGPPALETRPTALLFSC